MKIKQVLTTIRSIVVIVLAVIVILVSFTSCENRAVVKDERRTLEAANALQENQPTPTDIDYSLERYNLIRRAYWVNGMREKATSLTCEVEKPMGYITLISGNLILGSFTVDGKVSSLNSFLTANYQYYRQYQSGSYSSDQLTNPMEMADIDGSYGENDGGIFFFTVDGKYIEWNGQYIYSDIPMTVEGTPIKYEIGD